MGAGGCLGYDMEDAEVSKGGGGGYLGVPLGSYRDCRGTVSTLEVPRGICTGGEGACLDSL